MAELAIELILRQINPKDIVNKLSLGEVEFAPLKQFLRKHATKCHISNVGKTYVFVDQSIRPRVWAYITLLNSEIITEGVKLIDDYEPANKYATLPAIKIARLAVDKSKKSQGLGRELINFAISISINEIMPNVGCRFLTVDSKPSAVEFYKKSGFTLLNSKHNMKSGHPVLFIDLQKI